MTFRLSELAYNDAPAFEALCGRLRALGVVKLGALVLGKLPEEPHESDPERDEQRRRNRETPEEMRHRIMFAASATRPPLPKPDPATEPPPVVPRRQGARKADGGSTR